MAWAQDNAWEGHQGTRAALERIIRYFYWPKVTTQVLRHCRQCPACQHGNNRDPPRVPLCPMPTVTTPFE